MQFFSPIYMAHISLFFCNLTSLMKQKQTVYKCLGDRLVSSENSTLYNWNAVASN